MFTFLKRSKIIGSGEKKKPCRNCVFRIKKEADICFEYFPIKE